MKENKQQDTGESGETNRATLKRRDVIGVLAATGGLAAVGASQSGASGGTGIGGGPMSSDAAHMQVEFIQGEFSERPSAGVENRVFRVDDPSDSRHGKVYKDDGGSWNLIELGVGSVNAERADIGTGPTVPLISNSDTAVSVPGDYDTIQAAIDACPKNLRHDYVINVDPTNYSAGPEHLRFRGIKAQAATTGNFVDDTEAGEQAVLRVRGDADTPSNVEVASLTAEACKGEETPQVHGVSFTGAENPDVDESACVASWHSTDGLSIFDSEWQSGTATNPILVYKARIEVRRSNIDGSYNKGVKFKRGGQAAFSECTGDPGGLGINTGGTPADITFKNMAPYEGGGLQQIQSLNTDTTSYITEDFLPYQIYDDFRDGGLTERNGAYHGQYANPERKLPGAIRPSWSSFNSQASTNNGGEVALGPSTGNIELGTEHRYGEWTWHYKFNTVPSSSLFQFVPINSRATGNRYIINLDNNGDLRLELQHSSNTTLIQSTYAQDTDVHSVRVTRDYATDKWELFFDEALQGSATEATELDPDYRTAVNNATDVNISLRSVRFQ